MSVYSPIILKVPSKKLWANLNLNLPKPMINKGEV